MLSANVGYDHPNPVLNYYSLVNTLMFFAEPKVEMTQQEQKQIALSILLLSLVPPF